MNWTITYDAWVIKKTEAVLDWLCEWLSISQKFTERALIVLYAAAQVMWCLGAISLHRSTGLAVMALLGAYVVILLIKWHREPMANRQLYRHSLFALFRVLWHFMVLMDCSPPYSKSTLICISLPGGALAYMFFMYVVAANSEGERGRKRKLAWSKLKELFSWLPEPVPEGA